MSLDQNNLLSVRLNKIRVPLVLGCSSWGFGGERDMLKLQNTMSGKKEIFEPLEKGRVKIFTCGPSIYQRPHIGNYRTFLYEDVLVRYLEYKGYEVTRVLNFTDIEDKSIEEAEKEGMEVKELTQRIADKFFEETELLRMKPPTYNPRSSTSVDRAVEMIKILLKKGIAYRHEDDVFYDPLEFKGFGRLYGLDMGKWPKKKRRFGKDTYPGNRWNRGDFILWHACEEGEKACFDEDLGIGRPSWNVQDPAMATKYLGDQIDIHCGGVDNLFRHHDYNIAIAEGVSGKEFARYWLHGEHLLADGKKISKSRGNVIYTEHLLDGGYGPGHLRFYLIYEHYREKLNFTYKGFDEVVMKLDGLRDMIAQLTGKEGVTGSHEKVKDLVDSIGPEFQKHMDDDLDVKGAFDALHEIVSGLVEHKKKGELGVAEADRIGKELRKVDEVLQILLI